MKSILKSAYKHSKFENSFEILRIYLGIALFFKAIHFIVNPEDLIYFMSQGKITFIETFISHYVISAHLVGGVLMTFGLLTRIGAAIQIPVLAGALGLVHLNEQLFSTSQNIELTALVLLLLIIFAFTGSGNISMDYHVIGDDNHKRKTFIGNLVKQILSNEGSLTLARFSTKIRRQPSINQTSKIEYDINRSLYDQYLEKKARQKKTRPKKIASRNRKK